MALEWLGYYVKRDIYNHLGTLLIAKNVVITVDHAALLNAHNVYLSESDVEKQQSDKLISSAAAEIKDIFSGIRSNRLVPIDEVQHIIMPSISTIAETPDLFTILAGLQAKDDYTYRHNVGVAVFSNMIGRWLHLSNEDLEQLTCR